MGSAPNWSVTPRLGVATPAAANTGRDGSGAIVNVLTGGANGTRIDRVDIVQSGPVGSAPTGPNTIRLWWVSSGTARLIREVTTPNPGVVGFAATVTFEPWGFILPSALDSLGVTVHAHAGAGDNYNVLAHGGDL